MSLLLKALKQAEAANAGKSDPDRLEPGSRTDNSLELEPLVAPGSDSASEWVEPPGLLFGNAGPAPATHRPPPAFRFPQLSLVPVVALLAGLIAVGYGVYLYFALQPPDTALPAPPPAPPTALAPIETAPVVPLPPAHSSLVDPGETPIPAGPVAPAVSSAPPALAAPVTLPPPPAPRASAAPAAPRPTAPSSGAHPATDMPRPVAPIQFQPDTQSALLGQAHAEYQRGALVEAQRLYTQASARTRSVDALLGLAAIASAQSRDIEAQRLYREVMDIDPRNATAQAALLDLLGNTDGPATESRLKSLIDHDPSPQLYQTLGNLYADQKRWSDAQAAYFEAYRVAPDNADYAFNLAVSLDQLRQRAAALRYYEKALATGGAHRFDRALAEARVQQLKAAQP
ncbi:MAG: hypothetical protein IV085_00345 [Thiobacillus sp.]|nr:hypothetical protein [Thiobacillus sp.]